MKKLFLTVIIAGTSLIAANDSNDSKYTFDKNAFNLALTGAAGVTTGVTFIGSLLVGGFFEMAEMTIGGGPLIIPVIATQATTAVVAKAIADSIVEHTGDLDRNLVLNVIETAF